MAGAFGREIKLFYCYAREDKELRDELAKHLKSLIRQSEYPLIDWSEDEILPGEPWEQTMDIYLNTTDIVLLLISPDFMASDYCYGKLMPRVLKRHRERRCCVIPILLKPTFWENAPFSSLQRILPTDKKPVTLWSNRDAAFDDVVKGIDNAVKDLLDSKKTTEQWIEEGSSHNRHGRYKEAEYAYNRAVKLAPTSSTAYNGLGYARNGLKQYEEARDALIKAISLAPEHVYAYINLGKALKGLKNYKQALDVFEQAIKYDSSNALAYKGKGDVLILIGRNEDNDRYYNEARKALDKAINLDPKNAAFYYSKGFALVELKNYKQALKSLEIAINLDPNYTFAYYARGCVLAALEHYEEAIVSFKQASLLDRSNDSTYVRIGIIQAKLERYEEALAALDKAIKLNQDSPVRHYLKGLVLKELGYYREALTAFDRVIKLARGNPGGYVGKALVFNETKSYEEALEAFEEIRRRKSKGTDLDAIIINAIGDTFNGLRLNERAEAAYEKARERGYKAGKTFFDEFLTWPLSTENI